DRPGAPRRAAPGAQGPAGHRPRRRRRPRPRGQDPAPAHAAGWHRRRSPRRHDVGRLGSLIIVMLLLLYPQLKASELVGTDLIQAVPLVASAALGHILFGDFQLSLTTSL